MVECKICGDTDAYFVCSRCGRPVCSNCYHPKSRLCRLCTNAQETEAPSLVRDDLSSTLGRFFPLGIAFIFAGMVLMTVASILSTSEGGSVIIFPFFIGTIGQTEALVIMLVFITIIFMIMLLLRILCPRKVLRAVEKMANPESEDFQLKEVKKNGEGEVKDYLITLKMPGFKEENIDVRVFDNDLIVQGFRDGETFRKTYDLPIGFEPIRIRYNYETDFLLVKVSLQRKREA